jgi:adenylate cyclase
MTHVLFCETERSPHTMRMERRLAAILSADVQGYSLLMGEDEEATIRTLTAHRGVMARLIQQYRGRVVDDPGDNLLAEFGSVVEAVQCAVAIQRALAERNTELPAHRQMTFRIGINLGDVVAEQERLYGDDVNLAARLEGLAEAGGICISGTVYDQIETKLNLRYVYLGERVVKNMARSVRVYRIQLGPETALPRWRRTWRQLFTPWRRPALGSKSRVARQTRRHVPRRRDS